MVVESVLEQLDDSPESIILESVLEGMAEYFSKNLAREIRKGLSENADKALHNGGRPPYGLKVNPATRQYEIDETSCKAVQMYFDGVTAGIPLAEIARSINLAGLERTRAICLKLQVLTLGHIIASTEGIMLVTWQSAMDR